MFIISSILLFFVLASILMQISLWVVQPKLINQRVLEEASLPFVSVIIAARNEAHNLPQLISALKKLNYPLERFEILFGDDQSEDNTAQLIKVFCKTQSNATYTLIDPTEKQVAKANVLMQLVQKSKGDFLYFLDADMIPNSNILQSFMELFQTDVAGVTGVTLPEGKGMFAYWQKIDWTNTLSLVAVTERLGFTSTAMGNNMVVRKTDYDAAGGYEALPKSTVEDFVLYKAIRDRGRKFAIHFSEALLAETASLTSWEALLQQRKRWMLGSPKVDWFFKIILTSQALFYPVVIALCIIEPRIGLFFWLVKVVLQLLNHVLVLIKMDQKIKWFSLFSYEIYNTIFTFVLLLFYFLPIKMKWKERKY